MVFFVAWQVVTAVDLATVWVLGRAGGTGRRRLLLTVGPALAVVAACAGPLLGVFGPEYAAAADVLRVLLLGAAFRLVVVHELGALEAAGRAWSSARLHLFTTVPSLLAVVVAISVVAALRLVPTAVDAAAPGAARAVLLPVAGAYVLVQVACAAAVLVPRPARRRARPEGST
jgi:O-antigen/teichoic acid export membrane protein